MNGFSKTVNSVVTYPPDLEFGYDAMGQRVLKIVKTRDAAGLKPQGDWKYTYYVRDAAGNVLTTYNRTITVDQTNAAYRIDKYKVDEWTMYGASRLGVQEPSGEGETAAELKFEPEQNNTITVISRTATAVPTTSLLRKAGEKIYELSNHLGNVLVTVTDRLLPVQNVSAPTQTLYYSADVKSATDYSAFGAPLSGRTSNATGYRYSMNGQEKDEELGTGVTTAEFWEYDAKLGRRWNVDPVVKEHESPYAAFANNPIGFVDPNGADSTTANDNNGNRSGQVTTPTSTPPTPSLTTASKLTGSSSLYIYIVDDPTFNTQDALNQAGSWDIIIAPSMEAAQLIIQEYNNSKAKTSLNWKPTPISNLVIKTHGSGGTMITGAGGATPLSNPNTLTDVNDPNYKEVEAMKYFRSLVASPKLRTGQKLKFLTLNLNNDEKVQIQSIADPICSQRVPSRKKLRRPMPRAWH